jgi:hypothetical protein
MRLAPVKRFFCHIGVGGPPTCGSAEPRRAELDALIQTPSIKQPASQMSVEALPTLPADQDDARPLPINLLFSNINNGQSASMIF